MHSPELPPSDSQSRVWESQRTSVFQASRIRAIVAVCVFAMLAVTSACGAGANAGAASKGSVAGGGKDKGPEKPPLVRTAAVEEQLVQREIETTGYLEAEFRVIVQPEVAGRVTDVPVEEGQEVVKDKTVLVRLDEREAAEALSQLRVQKSAAEVDLSSKALAIRSAQRELQRAAIEKNKTKAEFDRNAEIAQGIISGKVLDDARFAWETAVEAEQVAQLNLESAKLEEQRAKNNVAELESKIIEATLRRDRHTILSPLTGIIARRHVTGGEIIGTSTELAEVVDPTHLVAYVNQPQRNLALVRDAKEVAFTTDTWPGEEFSAPVETVAAVVDRETGSFTIRIRVREKDVGRLLPGMFFKARILTEDKRKALMVPKQAVINDGDLTVVYAIRDGKAHEVDLDPGLERDDWLECRNRGEAGLRIGDQVVVSGQDDLRDQQEVEVVDALPTPGSTAAPDKDKGAQADNSQAAAGSGTDSSQGAKNTKGR